uniref:Uncharacterized protein n=1 Tax=Cucumis melo TaxID=3656 RepID=A0A9I9EGZ8_CUCME
MSNHGRTRMLDKSSLTIIVVGPSRFYNDDMSSLRNEVSQLTMWSYLEKHTIGVVNLFQKWHRMHILITKFGAESNVGTLVLAHLRGFLASRDRFVLVVFRPHFRNLRRLKKAKVLIEQKRLKLEEAKCMIKE